MDPSKIRNLFGQTIADKLFGEFQNRSDRKVIDYCRLYQLMEEKRSVEPFIDEGFVVPVQV